MDKTTLFKVYSSDECFIDSANILITVIPVDKYLPNLITPNGDGKNDRLYITNYPKKYDINIYNRWNDLVYSKVNYTDQWDGGDNTDGIYYYILKGFIKRKIKIF